MGFHKKDRRFLKTTGVVAVNIALLFALLFLIFWLTGTLEFMS